MTGGAHILIAEDEELIAMALAELLESKGFRVTLTNNGQEAIDADALDPADLLITDIKMPIINGSKLIDILRIRRPTLPVIVITGLDRNHRDDDRNRLVVLRKPFSGFTLVRHAVAFLR